MEAKISSPVVEVHMLIHRSAAEVFEAFADPRITRHFWFSRSSGRLEAGKEVRWDWEMYGASTHVRVLAVDPGRRIHVEWNGPDNPSEIEWTFEPREPAATFVRIKNWSFQGDADRAIEQALDAQGGFSFVLAGLKGYLEHGIELGLIADHDPDAVVATPVSRSV